MARIYKSPKNEDLFKGISEEHKDTINKMLEIQDILLVNPPNDKKFNMHNDSYFLEYFNILMYIQEDKNYNDEYVKIAIKNLHKKIFKNRRI
jgi:hypothetical protein